MQLELMESVVGFKRKAKDANYILQLVVVGQCDFFVCVFLVCPPVQS